MWWLGGNSLSFWHLWEAYKVEKQLSTELSEGENINASHYEFMENLYWENYHFLNWFFQERHFYNRIFYLSVPPQSHYLSQWNAVFNLAQAQVTREHSIHTLHI